MFKKALITALLFFVFGFTTATWADDDITERSKKDSVLVGLGSSAMTAFAFTPIENTIFVTFSFDREPEKVRAWREAEQGDNKENHYEVRREVYDTEKNIYTYSFVFKPAAIQEKEYTLYFGCDSAISGYPNYRGPYVKDGKLHVEINGELKVYDLPLKNPVSMSSHWTRSGNKEGVYQAAILGYDKREPHLFKVAVEFLTSQHPVISWLKSENKIKDERKETAGITEYDFDGVPGNYVVLYTFDTRLVGGNGEFSVYAGSWMVVSASVTGNKIKDEKGSVKTLSENATYFTSPVPEYK